MDVKTSVFIGYAVFGLILILFNKKISNLLYSLTLYYTDKLRLKDLFLFKVDSTNKNSLFFLMRSFTIMFGIIISSMSMYFVYF